MKAETLRSYRYRRFDGGMVLVIHEFEVFKFVFENRGWFALDLQGRVSKRLAAQLQRDLGLVVAIDVAVATRPDEIADIQPTLLRDHVRQQGVTGNVERHTKKDIGAALVKLATQFAGLAFDFRRRNIKLEEGVAWHERHF